MFNYIKMDLYKLFKGKTIYVCMAVFVLLLSTTVIEIRDTEKNGSSTQKGFVVAVGKGENLSENDSELIEGFMEGLEEGSTNEEVQVGVGMSANTIIESGNTLESWVESTYKGNLMIHMLLIIVAIFVCNDFSGGYIKNTINIPKHKWYTNVSKMVTATVVFIIENIISVLVYLFSYIFVFENAKIGNVTHLLPYIGALLLLYLGMISSIILICNYTRSKAAGIIIGMLMATQTISSVLSILLCKIFDMESLDAMKRFMASMATVISPDMSNSLMKEALILGTVGTVIYFALANLVITKKDI